MNDDELGARLGTALRERTAAITAPRTLGSLTDDRTATHRRTRATAILATSLIVAAMFVVGAVALRAEHHSIRSTTSAVPSGVDEPTAPVIVPPSIDEPTITVATSPGESTTSVAATTTIPTKPVIENLAIGESVMQGVRNVLPDQGVNVYAQESMQGTGIIEAIRSSLAAYTITGSVIIQSGTNGPVTQAQYDEMANLLAGFPHAYFMTVKAPRDWIEPNNALIRALPATHPNVTVIDWATEAPKIEAELSPSDGGIHLNSGIAIRFYSNLILAALGKPVIPDP